jgi:Zn-finger nucleic acid-binding protein
MICSTCNSQTSHVKYIDGRDYCPNCGGFKETGGPKISSILTRNSFRVRSESIKHEQDFILPHAYSKSEGKLKINDEFVKKYPDKVGEYYSDKEITKQGYKKLPGMIKDKKEKIAKEKQNIEFHGSAKSGIERITK